MHFVNGFLLKEKSLLVVLFITNVVIAITSLSAPYLLSLFIDAIGNGNADYVHIIFYLALCYASGTICSYIASITQVKAHYVIAYEYNKDIIKHTQRLPLNFFDNVDTVYLNKRVNDDVQDITEFFIDNIFNAFLHLFVLIGLFYLLYIKSNFIFWLLFFSTMVYALSYFLIRENLFKKVYVQKEKNNIFFTKLNEQFQKIKFIKANDISKDLLGELDKTFKNVIAATMSFTKVNWLYLGASDIVKHIVTIILLVVGAKQILSNEISIGWFVAVLGYFQIAFESTHYFLELGANWQGIAVSLSRMKQLYTETEEVAGNITLNDVRAISLNNIEIGYRNHNSIIKEFSQKFEKGKIYCILGESGIGKTSLISSLLRLTTLRSGEIKFDKYSINDLSLHNLRRKLIAFADQESILLNTTIENNLSLGCDNTDKGLIKRWLKEYGLLTLIENLPDGLKYTFKDNVSNLSGGQRQRINQIRCFLKNSPILILDEPTSGLDDDNIMRLKHILSKLKREKIIIIVTHDKKFAQLADENIIIQ